VSVAVTASLSISPATARTATGGSLAFTAAGGSGMGFVWSLASGPSGGTIDHGSGRYTAGSVGGVTDVVRVSDSIGGTATAEVFVAASGGTGGNPAGGGCSSGDAGGGSVVPLVEMALWSWGRRSRKERREASRRWMA
jgi:hypothetical protein